MNHWTQLRSADSILEAVIASLAPLALCNDLAAVAHCAIRAVWWCCFFLQLVVVLLLLLSLFVFVVVCCS